jgi:hypothetical protein
MNQLAERSPSVQGHSEIIREALRRDLRAA